MAALRILSFAGERPVLEPDRLPDGFAAAASYCDFSRGVVAGIRTDAAAPIGPTAFDARALYVHEGSAGDGTTGAWYAWNRDVDVARSPVVDDQYGRFYWSDGAGVFVSQARNGGYGAEPTSTNRWKVGVPKPSAAPTHITETGLVLLDVASFSFVGFCEDSGGGRSGEVPLVPTSDSNTAFSVRRWVLPFDTSSCDSSQEDAGSSPQTQAMTFVGPVTINYNFGGVAGSIDNAMSYRLASGGNEKYVHWADWQSSPLPPQVSIDGQPYHLIGYGWYCNDSSKSPPNSGGSASIVGSTSPAVEISITRSDGAVLKAIVRTDAALNTWPADLSGFSATMTVDGATVVISMFSTAGYATSRAYAYSYVNYYGEEGALSDPLFIDSVIEGQSVTIGYLPPPARHGYREMDKVRVYRTATGSAGTGWLFVDEVLINSTSPVFVDSVSGAQLGESAQTIDFLPPLQTLKGLVVLPNGIMAGFVGDEVHLSEPYLPYAFKRENIKTLGHNIIGLAVCEAGLYAITTSYPFLLTGATPDAMYPAKINHIAGGVAKGSICDVGPYVVYGSNDGLVMLQGMSATMDYSFQYWTRDKWRSLYGPHLSSLRLAAHDGALLGWFADGTVGFMLRLDDAASTLTKFDGQGITATHVSPKDDALYVVRGRSISVFGAGSDRRSWSWVSKDHVVSAPLNFGAIRVRGDGRVFISVIADGAEVFAMSSSADLSGGPFISRLPSGFKARRWSVELSGTTSSSQVADVSLASSMAALAID